MGFCRMAATFFRRHRKNGVAGGHDDGHALIMQSVDQAVGPFVVAQIEVDEGDVGHALGDQALGLGRGRGGSATSAPWSASSRFIATPRCQESSTNRT